MSADAKVISITKNGVERQSDEACYSGEPVSLSEDYFSDDNIIKLLHSAPNLGRAFARKPELERALAAKDPVSKISPGGAGVEGWLWARSCGRGWRMRWCWSGC